jgi:hypothetical protein
MNMVTECAAKDVETPSEGQGGGNWFARHVERVYEAVNNGDLVIAGATRLYTSWPVDGGIYTVCTIRYNGPPPETDQDFLHRHLTEAGNALPSHPPIP